MQSLRAAEAATAAPAAAAAAATSISTLAVERFVYTRTRSSCCLYEFSQSAGCLAVFVAPLRPRGPPNPRTSLACFRQEHFVVPAVAVNSVSCVCPVGAEGGAAPEAAGGDGGDGSAGGDGADYGVAAAAASASCPLHLDCYLFSVVAAECSPELTH